jgi:hypothetical protein
MRIHMHVYTCPPPEASVVTWGTCHECMHIHMHVCMQPTHAFCVFPQIVAHAFVCDRRTDADQSFFFSFDHCNQDHYYLGDLGKILFVLSFSSP